MALARLRAVFPDVSPANLDSIERAFAVLMSSAGPRDGLTRSAAALHARLSDMTGKKALSTLKIFKAFPSDDDWSAKDLACIRLLIHVNRPNEALALCTSKPSIGARQLGLEALALISVDKEKALEGFASNSATLDHDGLINHAGLVQEMRGQELAAPLWKLALERHPKSFAAMLGNGKIKDVLAMEKPASADDAARQAQALILLAQGAREAQMAVTAEGLLRRALTVIESVKDVKPIYTSILEDGLKQYALLLSKWDRREREGDAMLERARTVKVPSGLPNTSFALQGWAIGGVEYEG